jgi:uracil DNA glycosylase
MKFNSKIDNSWLDVLKNEFKKSYFKNIEEKINNDINL